MDGVYVLCVVLLLKTESVCFHVPKEKTCETAIHEWTTSADNWTAKSPGADKRHLCVCMTFNQLKSMKKTLFTVGDHELKNIPVEIVK